MNHHNLKIWPVHFSNVEAGTKTFEIRKNDRAFQKGDTLMLSEYNPDTKSVYRDNDPIGPGEYYDIVIGYTGKNLNFKIGDVYPIDSERVVFSLLKDEDESR